MMADNGIIKRQITCYPLIIADWLSPVIRSGCPIINLI